MNGRELGRKLLVVGAIAASVQAHGAIHEQIAAVTRRIEEEPSNAGLYLKRGELHREHSDWTAAWQDYRRAARLDPQLDEIDRCRGRMLLESERPAPALEYLDRYLARREDDAGAYALRGRARSRTGQHLGAARDYARAIRLAARPKPEYYLARARALARAGAPHLEDAIRGLDAGIARLGPAVSLVEAAVEIEVAAKRYDAALERVDRMAAGVPRPEGWLARRGEILERAGRLEEARAAYESALARIESLPAGRRRTRAARELEERVRSTLNRLSGLSKPVGQG